MGLGWIHKQEFKMKSTCTTEERKRLVQVECKCCNKLSRDSFKHKLYTAHNLWEEASLPSLYILCDFPQGLHPNGIFFFRTPKRESKTWDYCYPNVFECSYLLQNKHIWSMWKQYLIFLKKIFLMVYCMP